MIKYKSTKNAFHTEGVSLTEQEHKNSCDINLMIKDAHKGRQVRGGSQPRYGFDDTTVDPINFRIQKEQLETELSATAQAHEFSPEELEHIPSDVKKKFKFRTKQVPKDQKQNDQTNKKDPSEPKLDPRSKSEPALPEPSPTSLPKTPG